MTREPDTRFRRFGYQKTHSGQFWEVLMVNHKGGRKAHLPRRMCLCLHEDDAKCIAEALEVTEQDPPRNTTAEYWEKL